MGRRETDEEAFDDHQDIHDKPSPIPLLSLLMGRATMAMMLGMDPKADKDLSPIPRSKILWLA